MDFVANFTGFPAVQKCWKSVKIWQNYRRFTGGNLFLRHSVVLGPKNFSKFKQGHPNGGAKCRWDMIMSTPRIILASLPSFSPKLWKLVEIWPSSDRNNFAVFLRHGVQWLLTVVRSGLHAQTAYFSYFGILKSFWSCAADRVANCRLLSARWTFEYRIVSSGSLTSCDIGCWSARQP